MTPCDTIWFDKILNSTVRFYMVRYNNTWYHTVLHGSIQYDMALYIINGLIHGAIRLHGSIQYDMALYIINGSIHGAIRYYMVPYGTI